MNNKESPPGNKYSIIIFNAKEIGLSLKEVAVEVIKSESSEIESRWFHSKKDADLFIWKDKNKNIIKQQVTFFGQLIEWNIAEGLRTGLLIEDEISQKMGSSPLIKFDVKPQKPAVDQGVDIVEHVPGLSNDEKIRIIENFGILAPKAKFKTLTTYLLGIFKKRK
ncbi:MAG: hypothetical protein A2Z20_06225 [Bdellovibrionales bacterium RBG_16_40_8]|nr:MAG: hypothetical protein A2Z20_06225 [Bdellovibrionales bacterium RBG_16_40_8]